MKTIVMGLLAGCLLLLPARAAELEWLTSVSQAKAKAKVEGRMVLLNFTSSDRGGWVGKFKKETLDTPEFKGYAAKQLVLVELDFPRTKPQSADLKKANAEAGKNYNVTSFPTFVVLNKDGVEIGRQAGYASGGPAKFTAKLDEFKSKP